MDASVCEILALAPIVFCIPRRRRTINNSVGCCLKNLVDELVAERLAHIRGRPEESDRDALREDDGGTRTDAAARGDEDDAPEERRDAKHAVSRDTTHVELLRRVGDHLACPITRLRHHERVTGLARLRDRGEAVPLEQRVVGDASEMTRLRGDCMHIGQRVSHVKGGGMYRP